MCSYYSEGDGTLAAAHHQDSVVVAVSLQIKWAANRLVDVVVHHFFVAVVVRPLQDFRTPAISIKIGMHRQCTAIHTLASVINRAISNKMHRFISRLVDTILHNQNQIEHVRQLN